MMRIDEWFCSPIARFKNEKDFSLTNHCLQIKDEHSPAKNELIHSHYDTLAGYNIGADSKFYELHSWVKECVNKFSMTYGSSPVFLDEVWFNVYEKGDALEFHNHQTCLFSCVYYLDVKDNDSKIYFNRSPFPMMNYKILEPSRLNYDQVWYQPFKGLLLVFKSDTLHMVEKKVTDDVRISLSYNFKGV